MAGINDFAYGELVEIQGYSGEVRIRGKLKEVDCYVVLSARGDRDLIARFGVPNRNLELDWGNWRGFPNEFVIPATLMSKV